MLEPEKERRLAELFQRALDLPEPERDPLVERVRAEDAELGERLAALLAEDARGTRGVLTGDALRPAIEPQVRIGPYRLVRLLGEGGMGSVHLAEQDEPVRRTVALKTIRVGGGPEVIARFDAERQALARLAHPNVARIYDSGTTEAGLPWFAMEYCPGRRLDEHCDHARLGVSDRLRLLVPICDAVHHAHLRGVLHCDLKPANVIVIQGDGRSVPKVIDFGLARALAGTLSVQERAYEDRPVGTWRYISPEQADPRGDVDARADVWALGAILYEQLCGEPPFPGESVAEVAERLGRDQLLPPSERLGQLPPDRAQEVASARRTTPARLARRLRGDLDAIALRALERDRQRRYSTPLELEADLQRHLAREPVRAVRPTAAYVLGKLVRRRTRSTLATLAVALALLAAGSYGWVQALRAQASEQAARASEEVLDAQLRRMLIDWVANAELWQIVLFQDPDRPLRDLLAGADATISGLHLNEPLGEAALRRELSQVWLDLGESEPAWRQARRAWELVGAYGEAGDLERFLTLDAYIRAARAHGKPVEAGQSSACVELALRVLRSEEPDLAEALEGLFVAAQAATPDEGALDARIDRVAEVLELDRYDEVPDDLQRALQALVVSRSLAEAAVFLNRAGLEQASERLSRKLEKLAERTFDVEGNAWPYFLWRSAEAHMRIDPPRRERAAELALRLKKELEGRIQDKEHLERHWMYIAAEKLLEEARDAGADPGR